MIIFYTAHFVTLCVVCFPNVEEVSILKKLELSLSSNNFCCVMYFSDSVLVFKLFENFYYFCE